MTRGTHCAAAAAVITCRHHTNHLLLFRSPQVVTEPHSAPTQLQMFAWRPIEKGLDVIGVGDARQGKTVAYVLALVQQLATTPDDYRALPRGNQVSSCDVIE